MLEIILIAIGLGIAVIGFLIWRSGVKKVKGATSSSSEPAPPPAPKTRAEREREYIYGTSSRTTVSTSDTESGTIQKWIGAAIAAVGVTLAVIYFFLGFFVNAGQGEAKVILNFDQSVDHVVEGPAIQFKGAWQSTRDFDLFSQELLYAGNEEGPPAYSGGTVSGREVTVSVGGLKGGSTKANIDISVTYSLDSDKVEQVFRQYKSQERFTEQIIAKTVLASIRQVPADYTAQQFRGEKQAEAGERIQKLVNEKLAEEGVKVSFVNIQDIKYSDAVEQALTDIETAANAVQKAEEEQRLTIVQAETVKIKAEGEAQAAIAKATGEAEANRLIAASLTPEVLAKLQIDAYDEGSIFTIPEGSTPFVQTGGRG